MKNKILKIAVLSILPLIMIATIAYYRLLQSTIYEGRTQYQIEDNFSINVLAIDPYGQPWVADRNKLMTLEGDVWIPQRLWEPIQGINSIVSDQAGNMWFGTENGLHMFDGQNWITYTTKNSSLASDSIDLLTVDTSGRLWIAYTFYDSASGVTFFDGTTWTTYTTDNSGLPTNEITTITFDSKNRVWFGTTAGVSLLDEDKWITYSQSNSGLTSDEIVTIAFDGEDRAWIGTFEDGVGVSFDIFDGKEWQYHSIEEVGFQTYYNNPYIFSNGLQFLTDPSGRIWMLGEGSGEVRVYDGEGWTGLTSEHGHVYSIAFDKKGKSWLGTNKGLITLDAEYPLTTSWQLEPKWIFLSGGGILYIAFILVSLFIAVLLDSISIVAFVLLVGIPILVFVSNAIEIYTLTLPWLLTVLLTTILNKNRIAFPIILLSLLSAPFFDFLAPVIGVPFLAGGCGGMLISPILAMIISLITGTLGWVAGRAVVMKTEKNIIKNNWIILIGTFCGFIAGILGALIFAPMAC